MTRSLLQIGEVAALLGISRKTIRHYHKLGLLPEPERSEGGYRLYSAADLFALQRIRQLQAIGFSLQRIKSILDSEDSDALLHEILRSLGREIDSQIARLQAKRAQVDTLLQQAVTLQKVTMPEGVPPTYQILVDQFGDLMKEFPPEDVEKERHIWALLDTFHWPASYSDSLKQWVRQLVQRPGLKESLSKFNERYRALADRAPDDPEVRLLAEEIVQNQLFLKLDEQVLPMPRPFLNMFQQIADLLTDQDSTPTQRRFIEIVRELVLSRDQTP